MTNTNTPQLRTVCGSELPDNTALISTKYQGQIHYFCELECLQDFKKEPDHFLKTHIHDPAPLDSITESD